MLQVSLAEPGFLSLADAEIFSHNETEYPCDFGRIILSPTERGNTTDENDFLAQLAEKRCLNASSLIRLQALRHTLPMVWRTKIENQQPCIFAFGTIYSRNYDGKKFVRYITPMKGAGWSQGRHFLSDLWFPHCLSAEWL